MKRLPRRQLGVALLAMLAVLVMGTLWYLLNAANATSNRTALDRARNAKVLQEAKAALIGYAAHLAAVPTEDNPGRLPCPQNWGDIGSALEGRAGASCVPAAGPAIGWLPWRQLGLPKLLDVHGEQLWYVLSPGWALPNSGADLSINSNTTGALSVDAQANVVAVIIAPGQPVTTQACGGAAARSQVRGAMPPDHRNYLECQNGVSPLGAALAAAGPTEFFNDQVLTITAAELLPGIEAAVASRFENQIGRSAASGLKDVYFNAAWSTAEVLPYGLAFGNPSLQSSYAPGAAVATQGLLPFSYAETAPGSGAPCTPSVAEPRCQPLWVSWTGGTISGATIVPSPTSCSIAGSPATHTVLACTFSYTSSVLSPPANVPFTVTAQAVNVGAALRRFNTAVAMSNVNPAGRDATGTIDAAGAATVTLTGSAALAPPAGLVDDLVCGLTGQLAIDNDCYQQTITVPVFLLADHPLLDSTNAMTGWFIRNKWHEVSYYAIAPNLAPGGSGNCTMPPSATPCLEVSFHPATGTQKGVIAIAGRSLTGAARPNGSLVDWLEGANQDGNSPFTTREPTLMINREFNDRIAVVDD